MILQKNFLEGVNLKIKEIFCVSKLKKNFQTQRNFLVSFPENAVKNFIAGVNAIAQKTQEDERYWEEGGIRIQENRPKNGGREETQTTQNNRISN